MTQLSVRPALVPVKPQPNVYTLLLIVAILALALTLGLVMYNLMAPMPTGYGLDFGTLFNPSTLPNLANR